MIGPFFTAGELVCHVLELALIGGYPYFCMGIYESPHEPGYFYGGLLTLKLYLQGVPV